MALTDRFFLEEPALFAPVILGIGILIGVNNPNWLVFLLTLIMAFILRQIKLWQNAMLLLALGFYIAQTGGIFRTELLTNKQYIVKECTLHFEAIVDYIDETHPVMKNMQRITFKNIKTKQNKLSFVKTAKMTCSQRLTKNIKPGDKVSVFGRFTPFRQAVIPFSFNQKQFYTLQRLDASGIAFKLNKTGTTTYKDFFNNWRRSLTQKIIAELGAITGGIASALVTGDKSSIPTNIRDVFIKSGTAHILAISGLHMSLVATIIYLCLFKIFLYISNFSLKTNPQKITAILTILLTGCYLGLSGFSPSATRAYIMSSTGLIGLMFGRTVISMRNVSLVAFLILLINSGALFSVSFQLSFSAVVALVAFYERFGKMLKRVYTNNFICKILIYILSALITTVIATIATTPISIATFNRLSLCGTIGNIVAIPIVSFLIAPIGLLCLVTAGNITWLVSALSFVINKLVSVLTFCSNLPYSDITIKSPHINTLYVITIGGIILCLCKTELRHSGSFLSIVGFLMWIFEKNPICIIFPEQKVICCVHNGKFLTATKSKGRTIIKTIQRNLGFSGDIEHFQINWASIPQKIKKYSQGCFIWANGTTRTLTTPSHPYAPVRYIKISVQNKFIPKMD